MRIVSVGSMNPDEYIDTYFEEFTEEGQFTLLSAGTRANAERVLKIFDDYMIAKHGTLQVSKSHLVCFMLYRVVGEVGEDIHSGASSLRTFRHAEIGPLCHILRYQGRIDFTVGELYLFGLFRDQVKTIEKLRGEPGPAAHARPLYEADERRLRGSLTLDTASKRDHALIVLAVASGDRAASIGQILLDLHVREAPDGSIIVVVPGVKTRFRHSNRVVLLGDDAETLRTWIRCRRQLQFPAPTGYLFLTSSGQSLNNDNITKILYTLGDCAGYGPKFFSSHCFRAGYANRKAAEVLAQGGSEALVNLTLGDGIHWSAKSGASHNYVDPNLRNFFGSGYRMTLEEFKGLTPEVLHDLEFMHEPRRRALSWFQHSPSRLRSLCEILNVEWHPAYEHQQERCRKEIGLKLYNRFTSFCTFIDEAVYRSCKSVGQVLQETVGCLLEDDEIEVVRWTTNPYRQDLLNALTVLRNRQPSIALVRYAQCTQLHQLVNARQAYRLLLSLKKRIYCRKLHLGCLPNGMLVRLRVRSIEENIEQIRNIPELDLAAHFPGQNWRD